MTTAPFTLARSTPAGPATVWGVLTDFGAYGAWIPLTRMRTDPGEPRVGWSYTGRTGLGPMAFDDSMVLTRWEPPAGETGGRFAMVKTGRLLDGWADVRVDPAPGGGATVAWTEAISPRPRVLRVGQALLGRVSEPVFARAVDAMLAEALRRENAPS